MMKTLKPSEIAAYCDVHQRTVSRWIAKGELKGHKLPGRGNYRVQLQDFLVFLQKFKMPVPANLPSLQNPSVLVIEDELGYINALKRLFSKEGFEVFAAQDGFAAGVNLLTLKPDLVTLDINMPGLDGFEVLSYIRSHAELCNIKVIVVSGLSALELEQAKQLGADACLMKPFQNAELISLARQLIEQAEWSTHET
jgi:excisionase family DNA binding protein